MNTELPSNTPPAPEAAEPAPSTAKTPLWQRVMDNPWLLLALGVIIPLLSYTAWGWIELLRTPPAPLP